MKIINKSTILYLASILIAIYLLQYIKNHTLNSILQIVLIILFTSIHKYYGLFFCLLIILFEKNKTIEGANTVTHNGKTYTVVETDEIVKGIADNEFYEYKLSLLGIKYKDENGVYVDKDFKIVNFDYNLKTYGGWFNSKMLPIIKSIYTNYLGYEDKPRNYNMPINNELINKIKGETGKEGRKGPTGPQGPVGPQGPNGP
jgi:hypothetical protein